MTSWNGNIFRVTGPLRGEFNGHRLIPRTKASDAELWCFFLICAWINIWVNTGETGDLRHHRAHYDVTAMLQKVDILMESLVLLLVGLHYCLNMILIAVSTMLSVLVINMGQRGVETQLPGWMPRVRMPVFYFTWFSLNTSMDKKLHALWNVGWN